MTRVRLAPGVIDDLDCIVAHLHHHESDGAEARAGEIISAFDVLDDNPLIGRPADDDKRELVIGRGSHGYLALYRYMAEFDTVFVLALKAQRETGFAS